MHIISIVQYAFISWLKHVQSYVGHTLKTFWRHFDVLTASVNNVAPQVRRHEKFQRACHACCVQLESRPWAADIFSIPKLRRGMAIDLADGSFQCRWNVCEAKPILASHLLINHVDPVPSSGARFRPVEVGCFRHLFCRLGRCSIWYRWCLPIHRCLLQRSRSTGYSVVSVCRTQLPWVSGSSCLRTSRMIDTSRIPWDFLKASASTVFCVFHPFAPDLAEVCDAMLWIRRRFVCFFRANRGLGMCWTCWYLCQMLPVFPAKHLQFAGGFPSPCLSTGGYPLVI